VPAIGSLSPLGLFLTTPLCSPTVTSLNSDRQPCRLAGVTVKTLDIWSKGRGFNSRSGRYQVVAPWMGDNDCLQTENHFLEWQNKPQNDNLAFYPPEASKVNRVYWPVWLVLKPLTLCAPLWQVMLRSSETNLAY